MATLPTMVPHLSDPGSGFRGVLDYLLNPAKRSELLGGTMRAETARGLAAEFGAWRALNERTGKPVFHTSLSAAPEDVISVERWLEIAGDFMQRMGYQNAPWVAIRHHDTGIDHIHIVAGRIDNGGRYVPNFLERKRSQQICRDLEKEYGLRQLGSPAPRAAPTRAELAQFERTAAVTVKARLQEHLDLAARGRPTMREFVERLEAHGIEVRANIATTGRISGISFAYDGVAVKGSDLGRGYSWGQLQQRAGIAYDPSRDLPILEAAAARATSIITRRKPAPQPPAAGVPPQVPLVASYRHATILESRADLAERSQRLAKERTQALVQVDRLAQWLEGLRQLDGSLSQARAAFRDAFSRIFQDPDAAVRKLERLMASDGVAAAAAVLAQRPSQLGRLRGLGAAKLTNGLRQAARAAAPDAARALLEAADLAARLKARRALAPRIGEARRAAESRADSQERAQRLLPPVQTFRNDVLTSARALGSATVNVLSAAVDRLIRHAARLAAQAVARAITRSRDDDDRGRGR